MKEVLEPLVRIPGVRIAAIISADGVPVALMDGQEPSTPGTDCVAAAGGEEAFAGLCAGWLAQLRQSVDPLSWDAPRRVVMRATRGAIVIHEGPGAILLVILEHGAVPEELRVPMEGAASRMLRLLRQLSEAPAARRAASTQPSLGSADAPSGIFPSTGAPTTGSIHRQLAPNQNSEGSGEHS
ncbi:MAG: putative regulator of Ras-like GTPase activity (Roadblock/LC7/MglB family) [Chlamydiales bacterium]